MLVLGVGGGALVGEIEESILKIDASYLRLISSSSLGGGGGGGWISLVSPHTQPLHVCIINFVSISQVHTWGQAADVDSATTC